MDAAQNEIGENTEQECLYYLSRSPDEEGIYRQCRGNNPEVVIQGSGILAYGLAQASDVLAFIRENSDRALDIWIATRSGKEQEKVYSCGDFACENLVVSPEGKTLYFSRTGPNPSLIQLGVGQGEEIVVIYSNVDFMDISPDGEYLRFHDPKSGLLRVVSKGDLTLLLSFAVDVDLIGGWSPDSRDFLTGERNVEGELMVSAYQEISVSDQQSEFLFTLPPGVNYYQPVYSGENTFYVLTRSGLRNNTRQVIEIDRQGEELVAITELSRFDHFALNLDLGSGSMAFQRYDTASSKSRPEIMVWDKKTASVILLAENAVNPRWLR